MAKINAGGDNYIIDMANPFLPVADNLKDVLDKALEKLKDNSSDPSKLAEFQVASSAYNIHLTAQSGTVKAIKDTDAAIIQNFR